MVMWWRLSSGAYRGGGMVLGCGGSCLYLKLHYLYNMTLVHNIIGSY